MDSLLKISADNLLEIAQFLNYGTKCESAVISIGDLKRPQQVGGSAALPCHRSSSAWTTLSSWIWQPL